MTAEATGWFAGAGVLRVLERESVAPVLEPRDTLDRRACHPRLPAHPL